MFTFELGPPGSPKAFEFINKAYGIALRKTPKPAILLIHVPTSLADDWEDRGVIIRSQYPGETYDEFIFSPDHYDEVNSHIDQGIVRLQVLDPHAEER